MTKFECPKCGEVFYSKLSKNQVSHPCKRKGCDGTAVQDKSGTTKNRRNFR